MQRTLIFLAIFSVGVSGIVNDTTWKIVQDALFEALTSLSHATDQPVTGGEWIVDSQIANEESKKLQFNGEVLEEATKILVNKYGVSILEDANEVLKVLISEGDSADGK